MVTETKEKPLSHASARLKKELDSLEPGTYKLPQKLLVTDEGLRLVEGGAIVALKDFLIKEASGDTRKQERTAGSAAKRRYVILTF